MKRSAIVWAWLLCAGCATDLGIPFQRNGGHASVLAASRDTNYEFMNKHSMQGVEWVETEEGTSGWGYEGSVLWGQGTGSGHDVVDNGAGGTDDVVKDRKTDFYEVGFGVRQIFLPDSRVQPYFGIGGAFDKTKNVDKFTLAAPGSTETTQHFQSTGVGLYGHTGVQVNLLRNQLGKDTEFVLKLEVRGMWGAEYDYYEVELALGFGK